MMTTADRRVRVKIHPWARKLRRSKDRYILIRGGRWSTKSREVAQWIVGRLLTETIGVLVVRQYQNSIEESNIRLLKGIIESMGLRDQFHITKYEISCLPTGSRVQFQGIERNVDSIRSREDIDVLWWEEAHNAKAEALDVVGPTIRKPGAQLIFTWNPHYDDDPVEKDMWDKEGFEALRIETHWSMLAEELRIPALYQQQRATREIMYDHVWNGAYHPEGEGTPWPEGSVKAAFNRERLPIQDDRNRVAGVDTAWTDGEDSDYTAVVILDDAGNELRSYSFREKDAAKRTEAIYDLVRECYHVMVDVTEGVGRQTADDLESKGMLGVEGFRFTHTSKDTLVQYGARRLADGTVTLRYDPLVKELHRFAQDKHGRYNAISGHDDLVCAWLLGLKCLNDDGFTPEVDR